MRSYGYLHLASIAFMAISSNACVVHTRREPPREVRHEERREEKREDRAEKHEEKREEKHEDRR